MTDRFIICSLAAMMLLPAMGCQGFRNLAVRDAIMISYRDMVWARRAYNLRYGNCNRPYGDHFECGFCAGYTDICNGGDGYVPAMPPVSYRSYEYQSAEGVQCVNAWFEGYPAGVAAARKEKVGNYNNVVISKMINAAVEQEKAEHLLPSDVPVIRGEQGKDLSSPPAPQSASRIQSWNPLAKLANRAEYQQQYDAEGLAEYSAAITYEADAANMNSTEPPTSVGTGVQSPGDNMPLPMATHTDSWQHQ